MITAPSVKDLLDTTNDTLYHLTYQLKETNMITAKDSFNQSINIYANQLVSTDLRPTTPLTVTVLNITELTDTNFVVLETTGGTMKPIKKDVQFHQPTVENESGVNRTINTGKPRSGYKGTRFSSNGRNVGID